MTKGDRLSVAEKPTLYVGCALTDAPDDFKDSVEAVKEQLGANWQVLKFLGLVNGTAADVYTQDLGNVDKSAAFVAITDYPSTGLGMEIGRATELHTPTLLVAQRDARVTRMVLGAAELLPNFDFARYDDLEEDLPGIINEHFAHLLQSSES